MIFKLSFDPLQALLLVFQLDALQKFLANIVKDAKKKPHNKCLVFFGVTFGWETRSPKI